MIVIHIIYTYTYVYIREFFCNFITAPEQNKQVQLQQQNVDVSSRTIVQSIGTFYL